MRLLRTAVVVSGMVMALSAVDFPLPPALAAQSPSKVEDSAAAVLAAAVISDTSGDCAKAKKKVAVKKKRHKKKHKMAHKKAHEKIASKKKAVNVTESTSEERMTLPQVMSILKTTRDLSGKNLSGLYLVGVNLAKCNLKGVKLSHANLERADLAESNLERADLSGANLKMASLRLTGMAGTKLELAVLDGAIWKDGRLCATGSYGQCREFTASYSHQ